MGLIQKVELLKKKNFSAPKGLLYKCLLAQNPDFYHRQRSDKIEKAGLIPESTLAGFASRDATKIQVHALPYKAFVENVHERVAALTGGIESPAYLFRLIYECFGFNRGAFFLLNDYREAFSPYASINWLKKSTEKVLIPATDCRRLFGNPLPASLPDTESSSFAAAEYSGAGQLISLPDAHSLFTFPLQDMRGLLPYKVLFTGSNLLTGVANGFELLDRTGKLMIKPYFLDNMLVAFLIVSGIEQSQINTLDKVFTPLILSILQGRLEALKVTQDRMPVDLPANIQQDILMKEQAEGRTVKISYDLLLTAILAENNLLSPFSVKEDILFILGNFFNTLGRVYQVPQENVLYLKLYHKEDLDEILLIHQCYCALQTFFKVTRSMLLIQTNNFIPNQQAIFLSQS